MQTTPENASSAAPEPFARLGRWLDMFDEIRATDPNTEK